MPNLSKAAEILSQITFLLELKGENTFKIRAFHNASRILQNTTLSSADFLKEAKAGKIKGIGSGLAQTIEEILLNEKSSTLEQLKAEFPDTLFELFRLPGLGPKRIKDLYDKLKVTSLAELKACIENGKLAELPGFGNKMIDNLSVALVQQSGYNNQFLLSAGFSWAYQIIDWLKAVVEKIEISGGLRRAEEVISCVELVAVTIDVEAARKKLYEFPPTKSIREIEQNSVALILEDDLELKIYFVLEQDYALKLLMSTGSENHLEKLKARAEERRISIFKRAYKSERDIYKELDLGFIPAELRDGADEFERDIPQLIEFRDVLGVIHAHSTYSDGRESLEVLAKGVKQQGFQYLGISDHSQSAAYAGGLKVDDILRQHEEIDRLNSELKPFKIFKGIESDILKDGALDYPVKILESFDFVIASVHSNFKLSKEEMTKRLVRAIQNPFTTILGHCTGRLLLERPGYDFDFDQVLDHAKKRDVVIEINANPRRLDIAWQRQRQAKKLALRFCIGPDAHSLKGVNDIRYGVCVARKGWLTKDDNLSSLELNQIESYFLNRKKQVT